MTLETQEAAAAAVAGSQSMVQRCVEKIVQRSGVSEAEARRVLQHVLRQSIDSQSSLAPTSFVQAMGMQKATGAVPVTSDAAAQSQRRSASLASLGRLGLPELPLLSSLLPQRLQQYNTPPTSPPALCEDQQLQPPTQYHSPTIAPKQPPLGHEMDQIIFSLGQESLVEQLVRNRQGGSTQGSTQAFLDWKCAQQLGVKMPPRPPPTLVPASSPVLLSSETCAAPPRRAALDEQQEQSNGSEDGDSSSASVGTAPSMSRPASPVMPPLLPASEMCSSEAERQAVRLLTEAVVSAAGTSDRKRKRDVPTAATEDLSPLLTVRKTQSCPPESHLSGYSPLLDTNLMEVRVKPGSRGIVDIKSSCTDGLLLLSTTASFVPRVSA